VDLAPAEAWLLLRLDEHDPATPADLASRLDVPEDHLLPHLERLREAGFATNVGTTQDGGEPSVRVSPEGRSAVEWLVTARRQGLAEWLEGWSPEQHEEVARLLRRLARELLRDDP
jgi:DNA-binding MarR family transcriptional regulator